MPAQLTRDQLGQVLRRASELEREREASGALVPTSSTISEHELDELVSEVGMSREDVQRALAELKSGALVAASEAPGLADRLVGSPELVCERLVSGGAAAVQARLDRFLGEQLMTIKRNHGDRRVWRPAPGVWPAVRRAFDLNMRLAFPPEAEVETVVAELPGGQVLVRLILRARELRNRKLRNMGLATAAGSTIAGLGIALAHGAPELVAVGGGSVLAVAGSLKARASYQRSMTAASERLALFLDTLER